MYKMYVRHFNLEQRFFYFNVSLKRGETVRQQSEEYRKYIRSDLWKEKCRQRIEIAGHKCEMCSRLETNCRQGLQIHHITYQRLGCEDVGNDLIAVCGRCHLLLHRYYDRKRA